MAWQFILHLHRPRVGIAFIADLQSVDGIHAYRFNELYTIRRWPDVGTTSGRPRPVSARRRPDVVSTSGRLITIRWLNLEPMSIVYIGPTSTADVVPMFPVSSVQRRPNASFAHWVRSVPDRGAKSSMDF